MNTFTIKYGKQSISLTQSEELIGVRPKRNNSAGAEEAVRRFLPDADWIDQGVIGGFKILSVDKQVVDADTLLDKLRLDGAISTGTHLFELPNKQGIHVPTGDLYIEFSSGTSKRSKESALNKFKLAIKEVRGEDGLIVSVTPQSPNPIKVAAGLQENANVAIAEPDLASRAISKGIRPLDSLIDDQWHLENTGYHRGTNVGFKRGADARVINAWDKIGMAGHSEVVIAVIDDGFDLTHPDFSSPGKYIQPWDFTRRSSDPRPSNGDWHGTACAGVAVAGIGGGSVVGAAAGCTLMPVRWGANLSDGQIEAWFGYVATKGASVVSCSWGAQNPYFPLSTRAYRAIEKCATQGRRGKGCVIVFAAGNNNHDINDPGAGTLDGFATHPGVIAVSASTSRDTRSSYSNYGNEISVCAPSSGAGGWGILTSDVTGVDLVTGSPLGYDDGDYTYDFGGTSSACPLVAGIAALLLSTKPELTSSEVKGVLQDTARKIGRKKDYVNGHSRSFGHGCIDAEQAIKAVRE